MKRALLVLLLLVAGCSHSSRTTTSPSPTPSPSASVAPTPTPTPTPKPTSAPSQAAAAVGPTGTKVPKAFVPQSATFISDTVGWVLGESPCPTGKGACDVIARTRDGGASWRAIPSPKTSPDKLAQIRFADERNGFVTGDDLWATHDGGATWKVVPSAKFVTQLAIAAGRAWGIADAGVLVSAAVTDAVFGNEHGLAHLNTVSVHGHEAIFGSANAAVLRTVRHGQEPVERNQPCTDGQTDVAVEGSSTHWFVVCEGAAGLGHQEKHAFQSFDSGKTWKSAGDPPQTVGTDSYVTTDGIFVIDHQQVSVYRGGSWKSALTTGGGLSEGGFESARLGFCIGGFGDGADQTMQVSRDAGRTWKPVAF